MSTTNTKPDFSTRFWTCSTPEDDAAWEAMTREEQLAALRALANHPDTNTSSDVTMADIREAARKRSAARNG